jgi:ADP-heptose:LPS heptosyltransferase
LPDKIFILKPDGIGDFVLATGALRLLADEFGEENLVLAVLPNIAPLARQQFPQAEILALPLRSKRVVLNLFVANFLRIAPTWGRLLGRRFATVISLRHSRPYLHSFLLGSLRAGRIIVAENQIGRGGSKPRTSVEKIIWRLRGAAVEEYPSAPCESLLEVEAHRRILNRVLQKDIKPALLTPQFQATPTLPPGLAEAPLLLCPFSTDRAKDLPAARWVELASDLLGQGILDRGQPWILTGSADQCAALQLLATDLSRVRVASTQVLTGQPLPEFVSLLASARLVLTVDTAAAHFATALDRPTVIAFSGMHRGTYAPWHRSDRQIWLEAEPPGPEEPPRRKSQWHRGIARQRLFSATRDLLAPPGPKI